MSFSKPTTRTPTPRVPFGLVVLARLRKWWKCVCAARVEAWYHWCVCQKQTITENVLWRRERIFFKTYLKLQLPDSAHLPSCLSLTFSSFLSCYFLISLLPWNSVFWFFYFDFFFTRDAPRLTTLQPRKTCRFAFKVKVYKKKTIFWTHTLVNEIIVISTIICV